MLVSSNSPKKQTNKFIEVVKTNSFVRFLRELEDTKSPFEIIWPLENMNFIWEILHTVDISSATPIPAWLAFWFKNICNKVYCPNKSEDLKWTLACILLLQVRTINVLFPACLLHDMSQVFFEKWHWCCFTFSFHPKMAF